MPKLKAVIVVAQRKGGVGKTTVTRMLGEYFAIRRGWFTCVVDLDSQANLTKLLLGHELTSSGARPPIHPDEKAIREENPDFSGRSSVADIFKDGVVYPYPVTRPEGLTNLQIIAANTLDVGEVHKYTSTRDGALKDKIEDRLRDWVEKGGAMDYFDIMVLDTPPSDSILTLAALRAATHMVIPVELERQCVDGMNEVMTLWRKENMKRRPDQLLKILRILPNKVVTNKVHQEQYARLIGNAGIAPYISPVPIPDWVAFSYMDTEAAKPRSIFQLKEDDKARIKAEQFCDDIYNQLLADIGISRNGEVANG
jgi:chromosome partitioning protein